MIDLMIVDNPAFALDVIISAILGAIIGYERESKGKRAGLRTFSLICVGSCVFTLLSIHGFADSEKSRIAAQVITGIGFLGAAVIWKERGKVVHSVTTAADIWVSAAIGMAVGANQYFIAWFTTLVMLVILKTKTKYDESN